LPLVFEALEAIDKPDCKVEVVLIDNASTDETPDVMARFANVHGGTILTESRPGKSHALNTGLEASSGDLIIFLDDDAIPDRGWLASFWRAASQQPNAAAFAGSIRPYWQSSPPKWLRGLANLGRACGCTEPGRAEGNIGPEEVKGANFAVRRMALGDLKFDTGSVNFGQPGASTGGEDSLMSRRLSARGHAFHFVPGAAVAHIIAHDEMTLRSQMSRYARIGRGAAAIDAEGLASAVSAGFKVPAFTALASFHFLVGQEVRGAASLMKAARNLGRLDYIVRSAGS